MGTKMGRPLIGERPLSHDIKVRVDEDTYEKLVEYSSEHNTTIAESVRESISQMLSKNEKQEAAPLPTYTAPYTLPSVRSDFGKSDYTIVLYGKQ